MLICGKKNLESGGGRLTAGFTLIEALIATGVLGMGLILIAVVFPVGIKLTAMATERSIGTIAANEALAKVQLWGVPDDAATWPVTDAATFPHTECVNFLTLVNQKFTGVPGWTAKDVAWDEFLYPSAQTAEPQRYHWSALCRAISPTQVQITAFATRKVDEAAQYYTPAAGVYASWPQPVRVGVQAIAGRPKELKVQAGVWGPETFAFFDGNATIVDDKTGRIYRVSDYKASGGVRDTLVLTEQWQGGASDVVWVVPPAVGSTRNPVVRVMQTTMVLP